MGVLHCQYERMVFINELSIVVAACLKTSLAKVPQKPVAHEEAPVFKPRRGDVDGGGIAIKAVNLSRARFLTRVGRGLHDGQAVRVETWEDWMN